MSRDGRKYSQKKRPRPEVVSGETGREREEVSADQLPVCWALYGHHLLSSTQPSPFRPEDLRLREEKWLFSVPGFIWVLRLGFISGFSDSKTPVLSSVSF